MSESEHIVVSSFFTVSWKPGRNLILLIAVTAYPHFASLSQDMPPNKRDSLAMTWEVHVDGQAVFDLPGARAVTGIANLSEAPPTLVFADSCERPFQPGIGVGVSLAGLAERLGVNLDYVHMIGDTRTAAATSPPSSVSITNSRSFTILKADLQVNIFPNKQVVPYFQFGTGTLFFTESGIQTGINTSPAGSSPAPRKNTSDDPLIHSSVGFRFNRHSFSNRRSIGFRVGIDGYYLYNPIVQRLPATALTNGVFDVLQIRHHGFGNATLGIFYQFR